MSKLTYIINIPKEIYQYPKGNSQYNLKNLSDYQVNLNEWQKRTTLNRIISQIQIKIHYLHRIKNLNFLLSQWWKILRTLAYLIMTDTVKPVLKKNPDAAIFQVGKKDIPNNINMAAKIEKVVTKTKESNSKKRTERYRDLFKRKPNTLKRKLTTNWEFCKQESAKLRALRVHVSTCLACLRAHVPTSLECLRAHVQTCLECSHANGTFVFTCSSRVSVPCVLTCSGALTSNNKKEFSMRYFT